MGFGWLVCVDWLLGERETFICKVQPTIKWREKRSLIFTLYLSEERLCTNTIIFMTSLAGISNLHSCCCLLTFSLYKHSLHSSLFSLIMGLLPCSELYPPPSSLCCQIWQDQCRSQAEKPDALSVVFVHVLVTSGSCSSSTGWFSYSLNTWTERVLWVISYHELGVRFVPFYSKDFFFPISY